MAAKTNTTVYNWPEGSLIRQIEVRQQSNGRAVAYIEADNAESARESRQNIRAALRLKGWGTLSDHRDGKFQLRVSGLRSGDELLSMLRAEGAITGEPAVSSVAEKAEKPKGLWEYIKAHSLRISAIGYMLGNVMYFMSGRAAENVDDQRMAASFAVGDGLLGVFGGKDDSRQFRSLLTKLQQHMDSNGIEIPKNASILVETSRTGQGFANRLYDFMHEYINPIKIAAETIGGFFAFHSGLGNKTRERNPFRILGGIVVMAGWFAALVIPEKKPDHEQLEKAGPIDRAIAYIQEKPLRLAGWAGLTFNALTFSGAWKNRATAAGKWDLGAVGAMVSSNALYSISNKTVGGDIKTHEMVSDVYSVAAQILNKQPDDVREDAITSTAKFLGERPEIKDNHQEIVIRLRKEMDIQRQNPWFEKVGLPPRHPKILAQTNVANSISAPTTTATTSPASTASTTPATTISGNTLAHEAMRSSAEHQQQLA
jgi:hypothetical protein